MCLPGIELFKWQYRLFSPIDRKWWTPLFSSLRGLEYIPRDTFLTSMTPSPKCGTPRMSVDMFNEGSTLLMKWIVFSILRVLLRQCRASYDFIMSFSTFSGDSLLPSLFHLAFCRTSISDGPHSNMAADIFFMVPYKR